MDDQKLIRAANQIADFFAVYTASEAEAGIADHIQKFWEPRMRRQFAALVEAGAPGINPAVAAAWPHVRL